MKAGDKVKIIKTGEIGIILRVGEWDDRFNPYKFLVLIDGSEFPNNWGNFKESDLL